MSVMSRELSAARHLCKHLVEDRKRTLFAPPCHRGCIEAKESQTRRGVQEVRYTRQSLDGLPQGLMLLRGVAYTALNASPYMCERQQGMHGGYQHRKTGASPSGTCFWSSCNGWRPLGFIRGTGSSPVMGGRFNNNHP